MLEKISNHLDIVRHLGPGLAPPRLVCPDDQQRHNEAERHAEGGVGEDDERVLLQTLGLPAGLAAPLQLRSHGDACAMSGHNLCILQYGEMSEEIMNYKRRRRITEAREHLIFNLM